MAGRSKNKVRTNVPAEIERQIKVEAGFLCSVPRCANTHGLEIHHIDEDPSNHDPDNLLLVCGVCHSRITNGEIDRKACKMIRQTLKLETMSSTAVTQDQFRSDLERMKSEIVQGVADIVGKQEAPVPLREEDRGTQQPGPAVDAAAAQAVVYQKADVQLPTSILRALVAGLYKSGEVEQARGAQFAVLAIAGPNATDLYNLGVILYELGRKAEAEEAYRESIAADPTQPQAWDNLGVALHDLGRNGDAEHAYRSALAADPARPRTWSNLGVVLMSLGRVREAEEAYQRALAMDPRLAGAWHNLGILLGNLGRKDEAEAAYRKAIAADPLDPDPWFNLGVLNEASCRTCDAEEAYRKAVAIDPRHAGAWTNLGVLLRQMGRGGEAEEAYNRAIEVSPEDANLRNDMAYLLCSLGRLSEAEEQVRRAIDMNADCAYAHATLGLILFERNQLDAGRKGYEKAMRLIPDDLPLQQKFHYEYGRALSRNGYPSRARTELELAKATDATYVPLADIEAELAKLPS